MSNKTFTLPDALYDYLQSVSLREDPLLQRLREETANDAMSIMQIAPEQGQFMALLVRLMRARKALEIGTYTGYSALCVARALPADGALLACDINEDWTAIARRYWCEAGVSDRIDLRLAPALETLDQLIQAGEMFAGVRGFLVRCLGCLFRKAGDLLIVCFRHTQPFGSRYDRQVNQGSNNYSVDQQA